MAIAADIRPDAEGIAPNVRKPGEFARHPGTGAPYVASPTEFAKGWPGKKADLIALCAQRGINWQSDLDIDPGKTPTVAQLQQLLGPCPKRVQYGRPSSLGKQIENMTNIQKWSERAVALGLFLDPSLATDLAELGDEHYDLSDAEAREVLDKLAVKAKNRAQAGLAADRGTYVHERTEDFDEERDWIEAAERGEELGLPTPVVQALVAAWEKMLVDYDLEVLAVEARCVDDVWRQAGTLDRIARLRREITFITAAGEFVTLPAGTVLILDIKTGRLRIGTDGFVAYWHGYSVQLASYAQSLPYDPDTDTRSTWADVLPPVTTPCENCGETDEHTCHLGGEEYGPIVEPAAVDQKWAVIAHLDVLTALNEGVAKCRLVLVDLEAGRYAGALCVEARDWEKRRDVFSIPTDDLTVSVPVEGFTTAAAGELAAGHVTATEGLPPSVATVEGTADPSTETAPAEPGDREVPAGIATGASSAGVPHADQDGTPSPSTQPGQPAGDTSPTPVSPATSAETTGSTAAAVDPDRRTASGIDFKELRRNMLLDRYKSLSRDDKLRFTDLRDERGVDMDDLDAVQAVLDAIEGSAEIGSATVRRIVITREMVAAVEAARPEWDGPRFAGDEGPLVADAVRDEMRAAMNGLDEATIAPLNAIAGEAHRTVGTVSMKSLASRRRWEIYRALVSFARFGWDDALVRGALVTVTGDDVCAQPGIGLGVIVGMLELDQAIAFADLAAAAERGAVLPDSSTGRWLWEPAAA